METVSDYNDRRRKQIVLGQSMNQALSLFNTSVMSYDRVFNYVCTEDFEQIYKKMTEILYMINMELQQELIK